MITGLDALACAICMTGAGAVVAVPAAIAGEVGKWHRRRIARERAQAEFVRQLLSEMVPSPPMSSVPLLSTPRDVPLFEDESVPPSANENEDDMGLPDSDYSNAVLPEQEAAHGAWLEQAREMARRLAERNGEVSSDDIWDVLPPPAGTNPKVMGGVFADRSLFVCVRHEKSRRKINHGRPISIWKLVETQREKAA